MREDKSYIYIAAFIFLFVRALGANILLAMPLGFFLYFSWIYYKETREEYNNLQSRHKPLRIAAYVGALAINLYLFTCSLNLMDFSLIKFFVIFILIILSESKIYSDNH